MSTVLKEETDEKGSEEAGASNSDDKDEEAGKSLDEIIDAYSE